MGVWYALKMVEIIYTDADFLVVNKPTRLLTVPGRGADKQDCLYHRVLEDFPDALVVHRLDMDTSGLLILARTSTAQRHFGQQFEQRKVSKTYVALVEGVMLEDAGSIRFALRKDMTQRLPPKHLVDCVRGKKAFTEWSVLKRTASSTRVLLAPKTGRSHQLRVHLQSIGHPIVGDVIYGTSAARLMLHAQTIDFDHPITGEKMSFKCVAPF